eukprot:gene40344-49165_t
MADWNETKAIMQELEQLFNRDEDAQDVANIKQMEKEIKALSQQQFTETKELIKAMTAAISRKETEIVAPSQSEHSASLRKLADKENILAQTETIFQQIEQKNQSLSKLQQTATGLKQRTEDLSLSASMTDSRTAYAISLYSRISNITWDYPASAPDTKLKGWLSNEAKKEMHAFELDVYQRPPHEVADMLWEMIAQENVDASVVV